MRRKPRAEHALRWRELSITLSAPKKHSETCRGRSPLCAPSEAQLWWRRRIRILPLWGKKRKRKLREDQGHGQERNPHGTLNPQAVMKTWHVRKQRSLKGAVFVKTPLIHLFFLIFKQHVSSMTVGVEWAKGSFLKLTEPRSSM